MDLPTGPTIVCLFGGFLILSGATAFGRSRRASKSAS
jgi:hypothetical protein